MDKKKNKRSILEHSKNIASGYSIEFGNTTFQNTLEERIQAARAASLHAKQAKKPSSTSSSKGNLYLTNNKNLTLQNTNFQSTGMTVINTINNVQNLQKKIKQSSFNNNVEPKDKVFSSSNFTETKSSYTNTLAKNNTSCSFISTCKGGPMQRRLEAIKAKKLNNPNAFKCDALESTKYSNSLTNQLDFIKKNHVSKQCDMKYNEYNNKYPCSEIRPNTFTGHCDRTRINVPNTSSKLK